MEETNNENGIGGRSFEKAISQKVLPESQTGAPGNEKKVAGNETGASGNKKRETENKNRVPGSR